MSLCERCRYALSQHLNLKPAGMTNGLFRRQTNILAFFCLSSIACGVLAQKNNNGIPAYESDERHLEIPEEYQQPCDLSICDLRMYYCDQTLLACTSCEAECSKEILDSIHVDRDVYVKRCQDVCGVYFYYISSKEQNEGQARPALTPAPGSTWAPVIDVQSTLQGDQVSLSTGAKIAIIVGVVVVLIVCAAVGTVFWRRHKRKGGKEPASSSELEGASQSLVCQDTHAPDPPVVSGVIYKESGIPKEDQQELTCR